MRHFLFALLCVLLTAPPSRAQTAAPAPDAGTGALDRRWVFCFGYRRNREDVDRIKAVVDTAAAHGMSGMVLASFGLDCLYAWEDDDFDLLREVAAHCRARGIELIPTGFGTGYGGRAIGYDRNFAAALPVTMALTARDGRLLPVSDPDLLANPDLERHAGDRFDGYVTQDQPGVVSFADRDAASGNWAIRFENFAANEHGHGRLAQRVVVRPARTYRFSFKVRTRDLEPASRFTAMVLANGRSVARVRPGLQPTQDWTEVSLDFISTIADTVTVYAGIWRGRSGAFWLDNLRFREYGTLSDIVRRDGTPLVLRSLDRDRTFVEGRDFEPVACRRDLESLTIPKGSRIHDGERLQLACYRIPYVAHAWGKQISLCMSNPALYDHWAEQARKLHDVFPYRRVLVAIDEVRNGGGCALCQDSGKSMAQIIGECVTRQRAIFKGIDPDIEVMTWSDMFDPAHNAHADYYGVVGDFTGSWKYVSPDVTMVCWYHRIRDESLAFFSGLGFATMGAAYYDADDLTGCREWIASLQKTPDARGIMYTTWERKYELLGAFGDLVTRAAREHAGEQGGR